MSASDLVAQLAAAGTPPDLLAAVAKELFTAEVELSALADRRRNERERKARSRDVTGQGVTACDEPDAALSLDKSPQTPKINPIPVGGCVAPTRKATRISENWAPAKPLPTEVSSLVAQWPPGRERRELEGFRDYWISRQRDAARTDWDRTWWNRIRDQHDRIMRENRNGNRPATTPGNDFIRDPVLADLARQSHSGLG